MVNKNTIYVNIAIDLSEALIFESLKNEYLVSNKKDKNIKFEDYILQNIHIKENQKFLFEFGNTILNLLVDVKLVSMESIQLGRLEKHTILKAKDSIIKSIDKMSILELPTKIPMIVKPKDYELSENEGFSKLGGYLLNGIEIFTPLIIENWELKKSSIIDKSNSVIKSVNNWVCSNATMSTEVEYNTVRRINSSGLNPTLK